MDRIDLIKYYLVICASVRENTYSAVGLKTLEL